MKKFVPWQHFKKWGCIKCGKCCYKTVQLTKKEAELFLKRHPSHVDIIDCMSKDRRYKQYLIKKNALKKCNFLKNKLCTIQEEKPYACKMYPFSISRIPLSKSDGSLYSANDEIYYVYVSPICSGLGRGNDIRDSIEKTIELWKKTEKKESLVKKHT